MPLRAHDKQAALAGGTQSFSIAWASCPWIAGRTRTRSGAPRRGRGTGGIRWQRPHGPRKAGGGRAFSYRAKRSV